MKLKKILAGIFACAIAASALPLAASAEEDTTEVVTVDEAPIEEDDTLPPEDGDDILAGGDIDTGAPVYSLGDIDGNGAINPNDVVLILRNYAEFILDKPAILTEEQLGFADVNNDEKVNSKDATLILGYYATKLVLTEGEALSLEDYVEARLNPPVVVDPLMRVTSNSDVIPTYMGDFSKFDPSQIVSISAHVRVNSDAVEGKIYFANGDKSLTETFQCSGKQEECWIIELQEALTKDETSLEFSFTDVKPVCDADGKEVAVGTAELISVEYTLADGTVITEPTVG